MIYYIFTDEKDDIPWKADIIRYYRFSELEEFIERINTETFEDIDCMIFLLYTNKAEAKEIEKLANTLEETNPLMFFYRIKSPEWASDLADKEVADYRKKRPAFS